MCQLVTIKSFATQSRLDVPEKKGWNMKRKSGYQHFLFPSMFSKGCFSCFSEPHDCALNTSQPISFSWLLKLVIVWERD